MKRARPELVCLTSEEQIRGRDYLDFVTVTERDRIRQLMDEAFKGKASARLDRKSYPR